MSSPMHGAGFQQPYPPSQYDPSGMYYRQYSKGSTGMQGYGNMDSSPMQHNANDDQDLNQEIAD